MSACLGCMFRLLQNKKGTTRRYNWDKTNQIQVDIGQNTQCLILTQPVGSLTPSDVKPRHSRGFGDLHQIFFFKQFTHEIHYLFTYQ